jgi:hypothetical protein
MNWEFPGAGKQYATFARVPLCKACGNPFVPPGYGGCCSIRCTQYMEVARNPVLGDPLFGPQQPMLCRGGCGLRFESRGINLCPDCYFKARPGSNEAATPVAPRPVRTYGPDSDRNPRSRCLW